MLLGWVTGEEEGAADPEEPSVPKITLPVLPGPVYSTEPIPEELALAELHLTGCARLNETRKVVGRVAAAEIMLAIDRCKKVG